MIAYSTQSIDDDDINAAIRAMKSPYLTGGFEVDEFEKSLCKYLGVKYAIVMNSATSALHASYLALNLNDNDEIICPAISFAATSNAALMCGAKVKFCDIKFDGNIDETKIQSLITDKTKIIVSVDYAGNSVEADFISQIAKKHNIKYLSDSSHALGSKFKNKMVGTFADISVFSFHAIKPITTFEGGCAVTNDDELAEKLRLLRSHGIIKKKFYDSDMVTLGYNYRLSDVACAVGRSQLSKLDEMITRREKIAQIYEKNFKNNDYFASIKIKEDKKSSRHLYPILFFKDFHCKKQEIFEKLQNRGIGCQVHYKPIYKFSFYEKMFPNFSLKNAEEFYKAELSIPCHQNMSEADADFVANSLLEILKGAL